MHVVATDHSGTIMFFEGIIKPESIDAIFTKLYDNFLKDNEILERSMENPKNHASYNDAIYCLDQPFDKLSLETMISSYKNGDIDEISCKMDGENTEDRVTFARKADLDGDTISLSWDSYDRVFADLEDWDATKHALWINMGGEGSPVESVIVIDDKTPDALKLSLDLLEKIDELLPKDVFAKEEKD